MHGDGGLVPLRLVENAVDGLRLIDGVQRSGRHGQLVIEVLHLDLRRPRQTVHSDDLLVLRGVAAHFAVILDEEFPLGDGTADTEGVVVCPYCGEPNEIAIDAGGGAYQDYVEDCQVCCRPWRVTVAFDEGGNAEISALPLDE